MKHAGLIGYPLGHSISPVIHNAAYAAMGLDLLYDAWSTPPDEIGAAIERLRGPDYLGLQVTVPHKQAVMPFLDELDVTSQAIGAVNTIAKRDGRLIGHNTDRGGYIRSLREAGCEPAGQHVLILGYGGAQRAVAFGLAEAGAASIAIAGRRPDGIATAAAQLRAVSSVPVTEVASGEEALAGATETATLIVNCTPLGMRHTDSEGASPLPGHLLRPGQWVSDAVYNPLETALLRLAREAGARPVDGLGMLLFQAVEAIEIWTGRRDVPVGEMRRAALSALT